jgi:hypothetical protein
MLYRLGQRQKSGGTDQPNTEIRCGKRILRAAVTGRLDDVASMGGYGGVNAMGAQSTATSSTRPAVFVTFDSDSKKRKREIYRCMV